MDKISSVTGVGVPFRRSNVDTDQIIPAVFLKRVTKTAAGEITASSMLERFGFTGDRLTARIGDLSGGERRRFQMLRLLLDEPNVLLLDEPTNDLDIETLNVLEDFLDGWPGTLVVVSHDRYFLERVCDTVWALLGDGTLRDLPGGVEQYLELRARRAGRTGTGSPSAAGGPPGDAPGATTAGSTYSAAQVREARKTLARVEKALDRLHTQEARLHEEMARSAADHQVVQRLDTDLRTLQRERDDLESEWLSAAETAC